MAREQRESLKASVTLAAASAGGQETPHEAWITGLRSVSRQESVAARVKHAATFRGSEML